MMSSPTKTSLETRETVEIQKLGRINNLRILHGKKTQNQSILGNELTSNEPTKSKYSSRTFSKDGVVNGEKFEDWVHYTRQLSQNVFKNIIPTTKQILLNKENDEKYPIVHKNTTICEEFVLFLNFTHVLHPMGTFKFYWNLMILIMLIYTCMVIPVTVSFNIQLSFNENNSQMGRDLAGISLFIDCVLVIDVLLNFRTSYKDNNIKTFVRDENKIYKNYITGWFSIDIITSFPFELVLSSIIKNGGLFFNLLKAARVIRLLKVLRFGKQFSEFQMQTSIFVGWRKHCLDISFIIFVMVLSAHLSACGWWWIGSASHSINENTYISNSTYLSEQLWWGQNVFKGSPKDIEFKDKYIVSFYWSVIALLTTGYGDIVPKTIPEMCYVITIVVFGTILFGWIIGRVTDIVISFSTDGGKQMENELVEKAKILCHKLKLDELTTRNIIDYVSFYGQHNYIQSINEILVALPPDIRLKILRQEKSIDHSPNVSFTEKIENGFNSIKQCFKYIFKYKNKNSNNNSNSNSEQNKEDIDYNSTLTYDDNDLSDVGGMLLHKKLKNGKNNRKLSIEEWLKKYNYEQLPYVLTCKILFGDNELIMDDEDFFNTISTKIKKITIKEGQVFVRHDQINTLYILLQPCIIAYCNELFVDLLDSKWKLKQLPAYVVLGNLSNKYNTNISIRCLEDNGCQMYIIEKEDIINTIKNYKFDSYYYNINKIKYMKNIYYNIIEFNYHGLVIPYKKILNRYKYENHFTPSSLTIRFEMIEQNWTAKTIKTRKHFPPKDEEKYDENFLLKPNKSASIDISNLDNTTINNSNIVKLSKLNINSPTITKSVTSYHTEFHDNESETKFNIDNISHEISITTKHDIKANNTKHNGKLRNLMNNEHSKDSLKKRPTRRDMLLKQISKHTKSVSIEASPYATPNEIEYELPVIHSDRNMEFDDIETIINNTFSPKTEDTKSTNTLTNTPIPHDKKTIKNILFNGNTGYNGNTLYNRLNSNENDTPDSNDYLHINGTIPLKRNRSDPLSYKQILTRNNSNDNILLLTILNEIKNMNNKFNILHNKIQNIDNNLKLQKNKIDKMLKKEKSKNNLSLNYSNNSSENENDITNITNTNINEINSDETNV